MKVDVLCLLCTCIIDGSAFVLLARSNWATKKSQNNVVGELNQTTEPIRPMFLKQIPIRRNGMKMNTLNWVRALSVPGPDRITCHRGKRPFLYILKKQEERRFLLHFGLWTRLYYSKTAFLKKEALRPPMPYAIGFQSSQNIFYFAARARLYPSLTSVLNDFYPTIILYYCFILLYNKKKEQRYLLRL